MALTDKRTNGVSGVIAVVLRSVVFVCWLVRLACSFVSSHPATGCNCMWRRAGVRQASGDVGGPSRLAEVALFLATVLLFGASDERDPHDVIQTT